MSFNWKKLALSFIAIFALFFFVDWIVHGKFLMGYYDATAYLWRSMSEMNGMFAFGMSIYAATTLVYVLTFHHFASGEGLNKLLHLGMHLGLLGGIGMMGFYQYLPLDLYVALTWALSSLVKGVAAAFLFGFFDRYN